MSKGLKETTIATSVFYRDIPKENEKESEKNDLKTIYPTDNIISSIPSTNSIILKRNSNKKVNKLNPTPNKEGNNNDSYISGLSHIKLSETYRLIGYDKSIVTPIKEEDNEEEDKQIKVIPSQVSVTFNLFSGLKTVESHNNCTNETIEQLKQLKNPYDSIPNQQSQLCYLKNKDLLEKNIGNISRLYQLELNGINEMNELLKDHEKINNKRLLYNNTETPNETETGSQSLNDKKYYNVNSDNQNSNDKTNKEKNVSIMNMISNANEQSANVKIAIDITRIEQFLPSMPQIPKESLEEIQFRRLYIINDNKYTVIPLIEDNTYPFIPDISNRIVLKRIHSEFDMIASSKQELISKQQNMVNQILSSNISQAIIIGNVTPLKRLESLMLKENNPSYALSIKDLASDIEITRNVLSDGNGFYRSIAFALIEYFILSKSSSKLSKFAYGISTIKDRTFQSNNTIYDKKTILLMLKIILDYINNNSYSKAYQIFLKAFLTEPLFEYGLIKYVKMTLADYIKVNAKMFDSTLLQKQIGSEYIFSDNNFNSNKYINAHVTVMHEDPDSFIISIIPKALAIDMKFYYIEPEKLLRRTFICSGETIDEDSFIHIIASLGRYEIGYNKANSLIEFNSLLQIEDNFYSNKIIEFSRKTVCQNCKSKNSEIILSSSLDVILCKVCLIETIKQSTRRLIKRLLNDNYQHLECKFNISFIPFRFLSAVIDIKGTLEVYS